MFLRGLFYQKYDIEAAQLVSCAFPLCLHCADVSTGCLGHMEREFSRRYQQSIERGCALAGQAVSQAHRGACRHRMGSRSRTSKEPNFVSTSFVHAVEMHRFPLFFVYFVHSRNASFSAVFRIFCPAAIWKTKHRGPNICVDLQSPMCPIFYGNMLRRKSMIYICLTPRDFRLKPVRTDG